MKILIASPIHQSNDKQIKVWLQNVAKLNNRDDLLLVDSSPDNSYTQEIKTYCNKLGITKFEIKHIDVYQENGMDEMIGRSREVIRQYILDNKYGAWFSWKPTIDLPIGTISELKKIMTYQDYSIIHQTFGIKKIPLQFICSFDCTLIHRKWLEKFGFLLEYPDMPDCWHGGEQWFKNKVVNAGGSYVEIYGPVRTFSQKKLRVLIGAAIHEVKDYAMERYLKSVSELTYPADLLLIDNTAGTGYVEKVEGYLKKYKIKNYKICHMEVAPELIGDRKVELAQEVIRTEILSQGYDAWFSFECDQLVPPNALDKLVNMMNAGGFMMVNHNGWVRNNPGVTCTDFNVSLVSRECFEKHSFLFQMGYGKDMPVKWVPGEVWIKDQVLAKGGSILEAEGVISPIYHLSK